MIVAIDGPAGVGKSTIAKMIAKENDLYFLNTGSFYRAVTYQHLSKGLDIEDDDAVLETAKSMKITIDDGAVCIDGVNVEDKLHTHAVDLHVAQVSVNPRLRAIVNDQLREVARGLDVIAEGRDITTVVFPDAEVKCFFDAAPEVRAQRRLDQQGEGDFEQILENIKKRDEIDRNKPVGGLKIAKDAIYIDTSYLTINEVCEKVTTAIHKLR